MILLKCNDIIIKTYFCISSKHVVAVLYFDAFVKLLSLMHQKYHKMVVNSYKNNRGNFSSSTFVRCDVCCSSVKLLVEKLDFCRFCFSNYVTAWNILCVKLK